MNKQVHNRWVAASKMNEPGSGEALVSSGALFKPGIWSNDIADMEQFFKVVRLPVEPIRIDKCSQITNIELFIKSHMNIVKGQNGNNRYLPYLDRLNELKAILKLKLN